MKYKVLRDCYVNDRFWHEGNIVELPDDMRKSEKNFQLVEEPAPEPEKAAPAPKTKPEVIPKGMFWCPRCNSLHRIASKIGNRHLKYKVEPEPEPEPKPEDSLAEAGSPTAIAEAEAKAKADEDSGQNE